MSKNGLNGDLLNKPALLATCKAELVALDQATTEALWYRKVLTALHFDVSEPTTIYEDNQAAISVSSNFLSLSSKTKHIAVRYFAIRDSIEKKEVTLEFCPSAQMKADIFTKPQSTQIFVPLREAIGMAPRFPRALSDCVVDEEEC